VHTCMTTLDVECTQVWVVATKVEPSFVNIGEMGGSRNQSFPELCTWTALPDGTAP
jgi:hypothetical protein